ncbi:CoA transferase, partial [Salmonella enterica]|uniref:CoA transferase n=1 Tax=Salmonella enterica TaxID=28901 RepID=UPI003D2DA2C9
ARFATTADRARNQVLLADLLKPEFARFTVGEILEKLAGAGVPCGPINSYSQALADPQVAHMGWIKPIELPGGTRTRTFGSPVRI